MERSPSTRRITVCPYKNILYSVKSPQLPYKLPVVSYPIGAAHSPELAPRNHGQRRSRPHRAAHLRALLRAVLDAVLGPVANRLRLRLEHGRVRHRAHGRHLARAPGRAARGAGIGAPALLRADRAYGALLRDHVGHVARRAPLLDHLEPGPKAVRRAARRRARAARAGPP